MPNAILPHSQIEKKISNGERGYVGICKEEKLRRLR
jgi:hypothetical protein